MNNTCGVYLIINLVDGKFYIGSTNNFKIRKITHFNDLRNNRHVNKFLQNAYNKHNEENFLFKEAEYGNDKNILKIEQKWLNWFWDNQNNCYNINSIAGQPPDAKGRKLSEEHKKKISAAQKRIGNKPPGWKGKKRSPETCAKMSISMKKLGIVPPSRKGTKLSEEHKKKIAEGSRRAIEQYSLDGTFIKKWNSVKEALIFLGKDPKSTNISSCLHRRQRRKKAYGFIWKLAEVL